MTTVHIMTHAEHGVRPDGQLVRVEGEACTVLATDLTTDEPREISVHVDWVCLEHPLDGPQ